jgi:hypothetical protein
MSLYNSGLSAICYTKKMVGTITIIYGMKWNYEGHFQVKEPKRVQLDKELYMSGLHQCIPKEKPVTRL